MALISMATVGVVEGDYELVIRCHDECLAITEPNGELNIRGFSLWARGLAALKMNELELATTLEQQGLRLKYTLGDNFGIAVCMEALAWTAIGGGDYERAAVILGTTEQFWGPMSMTVGAIAGLEAMHEHYEGLLRRQLPERTVEELRQRGSRLSEKQALAIALNEGPGSHAQAGRAGGQLTKREREVAGLIRDGFTNRQIGSKLRISQRTAEVHVEHILDKLAFDSRVQIAAWVAANQSDVLN
jgi:non-specific serine/threonine protein kinase